MTAKLLVTALQAANGLRSLRTGQPDTSQVRLLLLHANGMGGTIRTVFDLAGSLAAERDVEIVSLIREKAQPFFPVPPGVRIRYLVDRLDGPPRGRPSRLVPQEEVAYDRFDLRTDLALTRYLRQLRGGVLITTRPGLSLAAALLTPPGVLTVAQEHVGYGTFRPAVQKLVRRRYGRLDALVTLTEADLDDYRVALGTDAPRLLARIPNAAPRWPGGPSQLDGRTVVAIGRMTRVKGFDQLLRAWQRAVATRPGWRLRLVGSGPQRVKLQRLVDELGLGSSVVLAGATRDVAGELDAASIFVLSSRHEGFPMTILEAMSRGVPVVSFDCPHGPGEMITNEREGLLVPPGDVDGLGDALGRLMDDPVARCRMGDHALRTSARYDRDEVHGAWSRLLSDLVPG